MIAGLPAPSTRGDRLLYSLGTRSQKPKRVAADLFTKPDFYRVTKQWPMQFLATPAPRPPVSPYQTENLAAGAELPPRHLCEDALPVALVLRFLEQPGPRAD